MSAITQQQSNAFYALKALAIAFVVMAHVGYDNHTVLRISNLLGTIGVPAFFFSSGFFFSSTQEAGVFWRKKWCTIVVPWIFWTLVTYSVSLLIGNESFAIMSAIQWGLGYLTWLYFVPVILVCFAVCRFCSKNYFLVIVIALFVLSNIHTTSIGGGIYNVYVTVYQNPFNWIGFFALGILIRRYMYLFTEQLRSKYTHAACLTIWLVVSAAYVAYAEPTYWAPCAWAYESLSIAALYIISSHLASFGLLRSIGTCTYPIYFMHMQFGIGTFRKLASATGIMDYECLLLFLQPIAIVLGCWAIVHVARKLTAKNFLGRYIWIFGF